MKHIDTNPDEAIDRVLTGLREAEPPQGMQQRVLHAARERADARQRWTVALPLAANLPWAIATASIAVIALAASWTIARNHRTTSETAHTAAHRTSANAPVSEMHVASVPDTALAPAHKAAGSFSEKPREQLEPVSDEDALALSEMLAPSKPAPPLPLTHQETLLAEVVHHGAPKELDSLRPEVRAREIEIAKAEFHDFFEPPALNPPPAKRNE